MDIHTWGSAALSGFNTLKEKIPQMMLRGGVVIEGQSDAEMPEQMLASVLLVRVDPKLAPPFPPELASYLSDAAHHVDPLVREGRVRSGNAAELAGSNPASCSTSPIPSDAEDDTVGEDDSSGPLATSR